MTILDFANKLLALRPNLLIRRKEISADYTAPKGSGLKLRTFRCASARSIRGRAFGEDIL
jgi:hypothetical protein